MLKILLRWWFWYVEDVVRLKMLKMFQNGIVDAKKKTSDAFCPWFSGRFCHFRVIKKNIVFSSKRNSAGFCEDNKKWRPWRDKKPSIGEQHIPGMLPACWTDSICYQLMEGTQKTVKHISKWQTTNLHCSPRNLKPLPNIHACMHTYITLRHITLH